MDEAPREQSRVHTLWPSVVGVLVIAACVGPLRAQWTAGSWPAARAADAKPLFLAARAVSLGADPLDPAVLQSIAGQAGMREGGGAGQVRGSDPRRGADKGGAFASMYPVTAAVLLQPLRPVGWADFVDRFRGLGFGLLVVGAGAAGAAGAGRRRTAVLGAALGVGTVLAIAPPVSEALGVAQANVHIAGLTGLALGLLGAGRTGLVGLAAVAGGGVKLLPLALLAPAAAGRRWRALGWAALSGAALLAAATRSATLAQMLSDVVESVRYQGAIAPKWVLRDAPRPAFVLFHLRQLPLAVVSAVLALSILLPGHLRLRSPAGWRGLLAHPAAGADLAAAAAVTAAWMAVIGAGSQRIYAVLQVPVWAWVVGGVAAAGLRWPARVLAVVLAALVLLPPWLDGRGIAGWDGRAVVLLGAWIAWVAAAGRLVVRGWPSWSVGRRLTVLGAVGWIGGLGLWWSQLAPGG